MHCKPGNLESTVTSLRTDVTELEHWAKETNLVLNPKKAKLLLLSTPQLSRCHFLDNGNAHVEIGGNTLERVSTSKLLCTHLDQHLKWEYNLTAIASSWCSTLAMLKKLKHRFPLIYVRLLYNHLCCLNYITTTWYTTPSRTTPKTPSACTKGAASFVMGKYNSLDDLLPVNCLSIQDYRQLNPWTGCGCGCG